MKLRYIAAAIVFLALVGFAWALVPPPPANQNIGIYDTGIATYNEPYAEIATIHPFLVVCLQGTIILYQQENMAARPATLWYQARMDIQY